MAPLPKLFIGSASEAKAQAVSCADALRGEVEVVPWWEAPTFAPMTGTLDALIASAQLYDFGLFLLTPDDSIESRGIRGHTSRDNVLFELGLFLGELGKDRCFALIQKGPDDKLVKIPCDLEGITIPRLDASNPSVFKRSVHEACAQLLPILRRKRFRELGFQLVEAWSYIPNENVFRIVLSEHFVAQQFHRLSTRALRLVLRRHNDAIDRDSDTSVVIGPSRPIPSHPQRIVMELGCPSLLHLKGDPRIDGFLFLMPYADTDAEGSKLRTIEDVLAAGGRLVEVRGRGIADHVKR